MPIVLGRKGGASGGGAPSGPAGGDLSGTYPNPTLAAGVLLFNSYAVIQDQKANNTSGGTFTQAAWQIRDLQTEASDPDGIVSIAANQFTLQAGTYFIKAEAPAWNVNSHLAKLFNVTDAVDVVVGTVQQASASANSAQTVSTVRARVTIAAAKAFEIRHRCDTTKTADGFGVAMGIGEVEIFTVVEIYREG